MPDRALLNVLGADRRTVVARHRLDRHGAPRLVVGRSLECDVVLDDPHVAAVHFEVAFDDTGALRVRDLGSVNGTRVDRRQADAAPLPAGTHLIDAGHVRLQLRVQGAALDPELPLRGASRHAAHTEPPAWLHALGTPRRFWLLALLLVAWTAFIGWSSATHQRNVWFSVVGGMVGIATAAAVWVGLWALIGRVATGAPRWTLHACILLGVMLVFWIGGEVANASSFAASAVLPATSGWWWSGACAAALLYAHLRAATPMRPSRGLGLALVVPGVVLALGLWQVYAGAGRGAQLTGSVAIFPPAMRLITPADTAALLVDARALEARALARMRASEDSDFLLGDDALE